MSLESLVCVLPADQSLCVRLTVRQSVFADIVVVDVVVAAVVVDEFFGCFASQQQ